MLRKQTTFNQHADVSAEELESAEATAWIKQKVDAERQRINEGGAIALPLVLKNCGILVEHDDLLPSSTTKSASRKKRRVKVVNRIEIASGMDFSAIQQMMVSEPIAYPYKKDYCYVHVLAFTAASNNMALLMPYLYAPNLKKGPLTPEMIDAASRGEQVEDDVVAAEAGESETFENNLKEWVLINEKLSRARHSIKEFHSIA